MGEDGQTELRPPRTEVTQMAGFDKGRRQRALLAFAVTASAGLLATAVASAIRLVKENKMDALESGHGEPRLTYTQAKLAGEQLAEIDSSLDSNDREAAHNAKMCLCSMMCRLLIMDGCAADMHAYGEIDLPGIEALAADFTMIVPEINTFDEWAVRNRRAIVVESILFDDLMAEKKQRDDEEQNGGLCADSVENK